MLDRGDEFKNLSEKVKDLEQKIKDQEPKLTKIDEMGQTILKTEEAKKLFTDGLKR